VEELLILIVAVRRIKKREEKGEEKEIEVLESQVDHQPMLITLKTKNCQEQN
jgi:hypothetical protein